MLVMEIMVWYCFTYVAMFLILAFWNSCSLLYAKCFISYICFCCIVCFVCGRLLSKSTKSSMIRNAVWCLSNLCRGKSPPPDFSKVTRDALIQTVFTERMSFNWMNVGVILLPAVKSWEVLPSLYCGTKCFWGQCLLWFSYKNWLHIFHMKMKIKKLFNSFRSYVKVLGGTCL